MTSDNETLAETCPARFTCKLVGVPERCHVGCAWNIDLRYQIALSGIPDEYTTYTVETLSGDSEHLDTLRSFSIAAAERQPKRGLYLTSPSCGNGKTLSACAVAMSFIIARTKRALARGTSTGQLVCFTNTVDLLDAIKAGFSDDHARVRADALIDRIAKAEMIVLDDLASERPTEFVMERFYSIINGIWARRNVQTLVVTSNRNLEQLEILLGPRIRSRVEGLTVNLGFSGEDRRRRNGGAK